LAPDKRAADIRQRLKSIGYDMRSDGDNIVFAGVMLEEAMEVLRRYGDDRDVLFILAKYLTEDDK